jgi:hypothetical protein
VGACQEGSSTAPNAPPQVTYGGRLVTPGAVLSINDVGAEPRVEITDCKASSVYALLMVRLEWGRGP